MDIERPVLSVAESDAFSSESEGPCYGWRQSIGRAWSLSRFLFDRRKTIEAFGMYDSSNLGDEAMRSAALRLLPARKTVAVEQMPRHRMFQRAAAMRRRQELVVGGGTLIHGGGPQGENGWLDHVESCWRNGARVTFLGTGISFTEKQLNEGSDSVQRWAQIMRSSRYVGLRGPLSQAAAARMGVANTHIFGDAAFGLYGAEHVRCGRDEDAIGINVGNCLDGDQVTYEAMMSRLLLDILNEFRVILFVVCKQDIEVAKRVLRLAAPRSRRVEVVFNFTNAASYMEEVSRCRALVGVRLHAAGLAMVAGTPAALISYKPKCIDFMRPIGLEAALIHVPLVEGDLYSKFNSLLKSPADFKNDQSIANFCIRQRQIASDLFD